MKLFDFFRRDRRSSGTAHVFFIRVGDAMADDIFDLLRGEREGGVILVRLLRIGYGEGETRAERQSESDAFRAITYHDDMLVNAEQLGSVKQAFWALSPSVETATPVVLILADEAYGQRARSWVQTFNAQYMRAGGLPIVRLVICQDPTSGAMFSSCFDIAHTDPGLERDFTGWCDEHGTNVEAWETLRRS